MNTTLETGINETASKVGLLTTRRLPVFHVVNRREVSVSQSKGSFKSPNFVNRTLFHGDNLDFLKAINTETVNLIATDPPFNTGRDFFATTPSELQKEDKKKIGYQDRWTWDDENIQHGKWVEKVKKYSEDVYHVIQGSRNSYGDDMGAFLCFMAARLLEMRRILKPTGSIYLHCDPTASHYLKELMDAIFGKENFRNEIIWCYSGGGIPRKDYPRKHDVILRYTKTDDYVFNVEYKPYGEHAASGRRATDLGGTRSVEYRKEGTPVTDWWTDIKPIINWHKEKEDYPTQKPLALYRRIIEASSNPGDVVLDPFCGCATTLLAAEKFTKGQKRQWLGIDIWDGAEEMVIDRLMKEGLLKDPEGNYPLDTIDFLIEEDEKITYINEPPDRTDDGKEASPDLKVKVVVAKKRKVVSIDKEKVKKDLLERDGEACQGCGREFGDERYLQIDHKLPQSDGGASDMSNFILLCSPCNLLKGNTYSVSGLRKQNKKRNFMCDESKLVQL